jgi:hypothetical protein
MIKRLVVLEPQRSLDHGRWRQWRPGVIKELVGLAAQRSHDHDRVAGAASGVIKELVVPGGTVVA